MRSVSRLTARLAVVASLAALASAACNTDLQRSSVLPGPIVPSSPALSADRQGSSAAPAGFAVLANAAVTCTDGTVTGAVGTFQATPTGSATQTSCPITGAIDVGTAASIQAYNTFLAAYTSTASAPCGVVLTGTLAGMTLAPGVYCFDAAATLTGVLTLQGPANGVWLFKIGTSGTGALTGTSFSVVMAGGGQACNVTWWAAQAATLTDSHFLGSILAGTAITLTRGTFGGNAWATADVTITGTAVVGCAGSPNSGKHGRKGHGHNGMPGGYHDKDNHGMPGGYHDKDNHGMPGGYHSK